MTVEEWVGKDNTLGIDIWHKKYQYNNETFDEFLDRVSGGDPEVRDLIKSRKFVFGGRILSNRGLQNEGRKLTYSNCYVVEPPEDNLEDIWRASYEAAKTYAYGGGCGIDISKLSPRGAAIHNAAKTTSGAVSFADLYNATTGLIGQNGRRGALMVSLDCSHPDLEEFIHAKENLSNLTSANLSVRMSNEFMKAAYNHKPFKLTFTRPETGEVISKIVDAYDIFHQLCEMNWRTGEPGILFWDNITGWNLLSEDENFEYAGVNPCAEEPLPAGGSCLLGALNLAEFVDEKNHTILWGELEDAVDSAVYALNQVLDEGLELHPLECQRNSVRDWRQIGLGIMGLADMFVKLGIKFGSEESIDISSTVAHTIARAALESSCDLARLHGCYPMCKPEKILMSELCDEIISEADDELWEDIMEYGLRNSQILTIAPTGSISNLLGVSGGIEPFFAYFYSRKTESLNGEETYYKIYTPAVKEYMEEHGITNEADLPDFFVTASDIDYNDRIRVQSAWQQCIDASISSTINVPNDFTVDEVEDLYFKAWANGLKGVTMFRAGCERDAVLKTDDTPSQKPSEPPVELSRGFVIKANDNCIGRKKTLQTGCGTLHLEAFFDPETKDLREVYLSKGSKGGCNNFMIGLSRMISLAARGGIDYLDICDQLTSAGACPSYAVRSATHEDTSPGSSCPVAVGKALKEMCSKIKGDRVIGKVVDVEESDDGIKFKVELNDETTTCPKCGQKSLVNSGGCVICVNCGYTKCE